MYTSGAEVMNTVFASTGSSSRSDWFSQNKILGSTYSDITTKSSEESLLFAVSGYKFVCIICNIKYYINAHSNRFVVNIISSSD